MKGPTKQRPRILEKHVQEGVTALLELDGWRAIRTDPVSDRATVAKIKLAITGCPALNHIRAFLFSIIDRCVRGKGFGEVGMPDYLYLRYRYTVRANNPAFGGWQRSDVECLWIEFKAPSKTPKPHQLGWHASENARGALVLVVDSFDRFRQWYLTSGLNQRIAA